MTAGPGTDIRCHTGSVGLLVDRCLSREEQLSVVWLIDESTAVTAAHVLTLYSGFTSALKVKFPGSRQEFGVKEIVYHPKFNERACAQMARKSLASSNPALALSEFNAGALRLTPDLAELSADTTSSINQQLSLPALPREKGLSGNLSDIDLPLVIQTITNGRKEGLLVLCDERNRPLAKIYCKDGKIANAVYGSLHDERAVYQIMAGSLAGYFYFQSQKGPDWQTESTIARPTDMLLIEALRRVDEIPKLLLDLGGHETSFKHASEHFDTGALSADCRNDALAIWPYLNPSIAAGEIGMMAGLDDYAAFTALSELSARGLIKAVVAQEEAHAPYTLAPLDTAPELPLSPFDPIEALAVNAVTGAPLIARGHLLGSLRPGDPSHLLHDIQLPPEMTGCPVFKDGRVVGMHLGRLPADITMPSTLQNIQQLIWVEIVHECLEPPGAEPRRRLTKDGIPVPAPTGCTEVARVDCPRCGRSSLDSARFCKSCGQQLISDLRGGTGSRLSIKVILAAASALVLAAAAAFWLTLKPAAEKPAATPAPAVVAEAFVERANPEKAVWEAVPPGKLLKAGDLVRIGIKTRADVYVYAMHQGSTGGPPSLIYPPAPKFDDLLVKGSMVHIPADTEGGTGHVAMHGLTVYGPPGAEQVVVLAGERRSNLATEPSACAQAFQVAMSSLDAVASPTGLVLPAADLGKGTYPAAPPGSTVYVTRIKIEH